MDKYIPYGFDAIIAPSTGVNIDPSWYYADSVQVRNRTRSSGNYDSFRATLDGIFLLLDGVVTNSRELNQGLASDDLASAVLALYRKHGRDFPEKLRGNFCGVIVDRVAGIIMAFTSHLGSRPLYYYEADDGSTLLSTDFVSLAILMDERGLRKALDETAAYSLLSFGYMLDERTLITGARRMLPGSCLVFEGGEITEYQYYKYNNEPVEMREGEAIDSFYELFMQAVRRGFEKDKEFSRRHICLLSGGLDSRMIAFAAKRLGFLDTLTLTFGQSGSLDAEIARAISIDLGFDHLFMPLDDGIYLLDTLTPLRSNGGLIIYAGAAHAVRAYGRMDWGSLGLLHNGNLADISHGDYVDGDVHTPPSARVWAYSTRLLDRFSDTIESVMSRYPNQECFAVNTRGINGMMNGSYSALPFTETDEPFMDIDLVRFASRLPPRYKKGEKLFLQMIEKHFPEATRYPWQRWNLRPTMKNYGLTSGLVYKIVKKAWMEIESLASGSKAPRFNMNPLAHWMRNNPGLDVKLHARLRTLSSTSTVGDRLLGDCDVLANSGNPIELFLALTLLEAERELAITGRKAG